MKVVLVGRPNVGKSTLFNRLSGKKIAIVHDQPGVTRDWRTHPARLADLDFDIIDMPGLEGFEDEVLKEQIQAQTKQVLEEADVFLMMVDIREGLISSDKDLAQLIKPYQKPTILLANKCEGSVSQGLYEFYPMGLGDPIQLSAEHGLGIDELYEKLKEAQILLGLDFEDEEDEKTEDSPLSMAIVGRPNVGKSTLINALLGSERVLTGDMPGVTRDSIYIPWSYEGRNIRLIDTAGIRRRTKVLEGLEQLSVQDAFKAIKFAEVVVLVLDATSPLDKQELILASRVIDEGRCLVLALNKTDLITPKDIDEVREKLETHLPQVRDIPMISMSALMKKNLKGLMKSVFKMEELWNKRLPTAPLNAWLAETLERHPTPLVGTNRVRIKYMTQVKARPPTFALFVSKPVELPETYLRYMQNSLRKAFHLPGVPIRFIIKKGKNPYEKGKPKS